MSTDNTPATVPSPPLDITVDEINGAALISITSGPSHYQVLVDEGDGIILLNALHEIFLPAIREG